MTEVYNYDIYVERWSFRVGETILYRMIVCHNTEIIEVSIDTIENIITKSEFYNAGRSVLFSCKSTSSQPMHTPRNNF